MKGARIVAAVLMLALVSGCGREDTTSKGDEWKLGGEEGAEDVVGQRGAYTQPPRLV